MRYLAVVIFAVSLALSVSSCNSGQGDLKPRSLEFIHKSLDINASISYMTPIMQESMKSLMQGAPAFTSGAGFAMPGAAAQLQRLGQEALSNVTEANLAIQVKSKWAQVTVTVSMPYGQEVIKTHWIRLDNVWYIYSGSGGEVTEYGEVPYFVG